MSRYDVYGLGNALVDMEYRVEPGDLEAMGIEKGVMTLVDVDHQSELMVYLDRHHVHRSAGGSAANTVIAVAQFGGRGFYTCKVAADELGDLYADDLRANGVETNAREASEDGHTGRCLVFVTPDADRTMATYLGITGGLGQGELVPEALEASRFLYMEGYLTTSESALDAAIHARGLARRAGVGTALSLSDPGIVDNFRGQLLDIIGDGLDLVFANADEAMGLAESDRLDDAVSWMKGVAREFVITRGAEGALVWDGQSLTRVDAEPVTPLDTVGAGDMFAGAFLYGRTRGWSKPRRARLASAAAARLITSYGARLPAEETRAIRDRLAAA
ncbi:MAG: adenosine kinase [Halofilum sp. (in: g-proteobacteria)]|nr:adenosine kinase [Halofilum sp. (in: g-proteobacteria)]